MGGGDEPEEEIVGVEVCWDEAEAATEAGAADVVDVMWFAVEVGDLGA